MSIFSMTGYAIASEKSIVGTLTLELRSVNSRFLDLQFKINDEFRGLEPILREMIAARITRGKLECRLSLTRETSQNDNELSINTQLLKKLSKIQEQILLQCPRAQVFSVNELLRWPGMTSEVNLCQQTLHKTTVLALTNCLDALHACRSREGAALGTFLLARIDEMESILARVAPQIPLQIEQFRQKAIARMQEVIGPAQATSTPSSILNMDEISERIRQEVTLYGIKIDVAEELERMRAHLAENRQILKKGGGVGKRLDFMMQELNREANTLGSKSAIKDLSDASMALKLLIEQMREQVQNLE